MPQSPPGFHAIFTSFFIETGRLLSELKFNRAVFDIFLVISVKTSLVSF